MKTLDDLIKYVYRKYPYPDVGWSKIHFEKRCIEIYTYEQVIMKCMDSPFTDPKDVIDDYAMSIIFSKNYIDSKHSLAIINTIEETLNDLHNYFI